MKFDQFDKEDAGPTPSSAHHATAFPLCGQYLKIWLNPRQLGEREGVQCQRGTNIYKQVGDICQVLWK
jgi:hypothetical protein